MVNVQDSLNLDARTTSMSAPYAEHQRGLSALTFNAAMASEILQVCDLQQHLCLGNAKYNSGQCCYGGQRSKNKAIFFPTANRSQKRLYFQTDLIKGLPPLAMRAVVTNR